MLYVSYLRKTWCAAYACVSGRVISSERDPEEKHETEKRTRPRATATPKGDDELLALVGMDDDIDGC